MIKIGFTRSFLHDYVYKSSCGESYYILFTGPFQYSGCNCFASLHYTLFHLQGLSCTLGVIVCIITLHFISFTEPFLYSGWEYQGADVDEEEEDMEADAAAAEEEEEEGGEEVSSKGDNSRI